MQLPTVDYSRQISRNACKLCREFLVRRDKDCGSRSNAVPGGEFSCRPLGHQNLDSSGSDAFARSEAQPVILPYSCGPLDWGGPWTWVGLWIFNLHMTVVEGLRSVINSKNQCWFRTPTLITGRGRLVGWAAFEKIGAATLNMIFSVTNSNCLAQ
jgi:hypothetical protein